MIAAIILIAASLAGSTVKAESTMLMGIETPRSRTLLSENGELFYGLQLTRREGRVCQVRAFFRGAPPRTAGLCRGRVTSRLLARSGVAVLGLGEAVHGIGTCSTPDQRIVAVRFDTGAGGDLTAQAEDCAGPYQQIRCEGDRVVQGVQLYFGGATWWRPQPSLQGVRALCAARVRR
tara:strand:+ start:12319 stop:12849 length:531 start_codon:yes stop_codon:yes gene_type:complete